MKFKSLGFILAITTSLVATRVDSSQIRMIHAKIQRHHQALTQSDNSVNESMQSRLKVAGLTEAEFKPFFGKLQTAVKQDNAVALSKMISYPIAVFDSRGKKTILKNPRQAIASYQKFATPSWKKSIANYRYEDLFANYKGVMVDNGKIWINAICNDNSCTKHQIKISTINY
jgi:hypothetical protein